MDNECFKDCISLEEVILPNGLNKICKELFSGCINLSKLCIPKSVSEISEGVINNVKQGINIIYEGSSKAWNELSKDRNVLVQTSSINDFHYYGSWAEKMVPDVYEKEIIIQKNLKYIVHCLEDNKVIIVE